MTDKIMILLVVLVVGIPIIMFAIFSQAEDETIGFLLNDPFEVTVNLFGDGVFWEVEDDYLKPNESIAGTTNVNVTGNLSGNNFIGEMWNHTDGGWVFPIASANVYYNLTNLTAGELNGFSFTTGAQTDGGSYLTANVPGIYDVEYSISFSGGVTKDYEIGIFHNWGEYEKCQGYRTGSSGIGSQGAGCFMRIEAGDIINIQIENEDTSQDATIYYVNLRATREGD